MIKYKYINKSTEKQKNLLQINKMGEENYHYVNELDGILIFSKTVVSKKDRENKQATKSKEFIEFYNLYKTIKPNGLSDSKLILKYNELVAEGLHNKIMENVKEYKTYLEVKKKLEYALMPTTYINQARYNDKWEIVQDMSRKFINDMFIERKLNKDQIENCLTEINSWETKQKKEITTGIVTNIINYVLGIES